VVDDTVGTYANVNLLQECDVVCTSLTKMFSGGCNVMGGSVTLVPTSPWGDRLRVALQKGCDEEPGWFGEDVVIMEENSRDFEERVHKASANAEFVVDLLRKRGGRKGW
jgi:cystathionine gamma-synthase